MESQSQSISSIATDPSGQFVRTLSVNTSFPNFFVHFSNLGPTRRNQTFSPNQSHRMLHFQLAIPVTSNQGKIKAFPSLHCKGFTLHCLLLGFCQMQVMVADSLLHQSLNKKPLLVLTWVFYFVCLFPKKR